MTETKIETGSQPKQQKTPFQANIAFDWWDSLTGKSSNGRKDKAALAQLRRCRNPTEVMFIPAGIYFMRRITGIDNDSKKHIKLALAATIAGVLSHVREDSPVKTARAVGVKKETELESALMSTARFRRLLQVKSSNTDELFTHMVRLVKLQKGIVNVADIASAIFYWNEKTKQDWAMNYYIVPKPSKNKKEGGTK